MPLFKKLQEYKIKGLPILSLNMILLAMSIALINLKSTLKYLRGLVGQTRSVNDSYPFYWRYRSVTLVTLRGPQMMMILQIS